MTLFDTIVCIKDEQKSFHPGSCCSCLSSLLNNPFVSPYFHKLIWGRLIIKICKWMGWVGFFRTVHCENFCLDTSAVHFVAKWKICWLRLGNNFKLKKRSFKISQNFEQFWQAKTKKVPETKEWKFSNINIA